MNSFLYEREKLCNLFLDRVGQIVSDNPGLEDHNHICEKTSGQLVSTNELEWPFLVKRNSVCVGVRVCVLAIQSLTQIILGS